MAKISAYGAHEVVRFRAENAAEQTFLVVVTSDGRILKRQSGPGNSYNLVAKMKKESAQDPIRVRGLAHIWAARNGLVMDEEGGR